MSETEVEDRSQLALIAAVTATVFWGIGPLAIRAIDAPAPLTAFWRLWIAVPFAILFAKVSGNPLTLAILRRSALGGVLFAGSLVTSWIAIRQTSVANATLIPAFQPVFILLVAGALFGERVTRRDLLLGAIGLVAIVVFVLAGSDTSGASLSGDLWAVVTVVIWAGYFIELKRRRSGDLATMPFLAGIMLSGAIAMTPFALVAEGWPHALHGTDWLLVLFVVMVPGFLGHGMMTWAQAHAPVSLLSVLTLTSPVVSAIGAWILFDQGLVGLQVAAGMVVLGTTAAVVLRHRAVPTEPEGAT